MFSIKRHIALLSVFVLLIPSVIQFAHAFEDHEHVICTSIDDQHFHEEDLDCSQLHYQFEVFSQDFTIDFTIIPSTFFKTRFNLQPQFIPVYHVVKTLPRAPPYFTS